MALSDILDYIERIGDLVILKLLTLGIISKRPPTKEVIVNEVFRHAQSIDELIELITYHVRAYESIVQTYQVVDELVEIYKAWFDPNWNYRKSHEVIGSTSGGVADYQMVVVVHYTAGTDSGEHVYLAGKCRLDFGDIRFTAGDGVTLLDYWIEEKIDGDYAKIWVEIPFIPLGPDKTKMYIYYGNPNATTTSNGDATFIFFDEFIDLAKWNVLGTSPPSIVNGWLKTASTSGTTSYVTSKSTIPSARHRMRFKFYSPGGYTWRGSFQYMDSANWNNHIWWWLAADPGIELELGTGYGGVGDGGRVSTNIAVEHWAEILQYQFSYVRFLLDGVLRRTSTNASAMIPPDGRAIRLFFGDRWSDSGYGDVRWDKLMIGKYIDPEPSHGAWGSEETKP